MTHSIAVKSAPSECEIDGSDTATMLESRLIMNEGTDTHRSTSTAREAFPEELFGHGDVLQCRLVAYTRNYVHIQVSAASNDPGPSAKKPAGARHFTPCGERSGAPPRNRTATACDSRKPSRSPASSVLRSGPPRAEKPPGLFPAARILWQGTTMAKGLVASAWPTSRESLDVTHAPGDVAVGKRRSGRYAPRDCVDAACRIRKRPSCRARCPTGRRFRRPEEPSCPGSPAAPNRRLAFHDGGASPHEAFARHGFRRLRKLHRQQALAAPGGDASSDRRVEPRKALMIG